MSTQSLRPDGLELVQPEINRRRPAPSPVRAPIRRWSDAGQRLNGSLADVEADRFPRCRDCAHPLMFHTAHGCTVRSSGTADDAPRCCDCDVSVPA